MILEYYSNIKDGKLQRNISEQISNDIKAFEGKRIEIKIQKLKSTRSIQQNRLWWMYVTIIAKELGYDKNEMHEICKYKFLKKEKLDENTGEIFEYVGSTAKLSRIDFVELIDGLIQWSAEVFSIVLPSPNEQLEIKLN